MEFFTNYVEWSAHKTRKISRFNKPVNKIQRISQDVYIVNKDVIFLYINIFIELKHVL